MKTKEIYLKDIKQGDKVASTFLAAEKNMAFSLKGSPYLNVRLKDKTGELDGKVWENAMELDQQFKKGDIIYIEGKAANYKNSIQISIVKIIKNAWEDVEPADYLPAAKGDVVAMFNEMIAYVEKIQTKPLQDLLQAFFHDQKTVELFQRAPAAKGFHHIYLGGLLEHTLSVVRLLEKVSEHYPTSTRTCLLPEVFFMISGKYMNFLMTT